jgi:glycosyltransferase involved in cell wall biosynthesis
MKRQEPPVLVVNKSCREMNYLAEGLALAGLLKAYVYPYANQGRLWERALSRFLGFGRVYARTFSRRVAPAGLGPGNIVEAALWEDLACAACRYFGGRAAEALAEGLDARIHKRLRTVAARHAADAQMVVSSYVVAKPAFARTSGIKLLNYPIAHHHYIRQFVAEEAQREPAFASMLPDWNAVPAEYVAGLDDEIAAADRILVGSGFARDSFLAEGVPSDKLSVIPYGADLTHFQPATERECRHDGLRLLFVGQIGQRKGISYLLRAYRAFRGPETELTLVGNPVGNPQPLAPYRDDFTHIPHLPQSGLAGIYQRADVFVFPSLIEGLGLVVLEAMASGLPVITTPNGPGEVVRDGVDGFVVPIRDVAAIVDKLEYLRTHPEERLRMGRNAREWALNFTWMRYQTRILDLIRELLPTTSVDQPNGACPHGA